MNEPQATQSIPLPVANCDQEVWVRNTILCAIRMALAVKRAEGVRADEPLTKCAIDGIANGAAVEIIRSLGMTPEFRNLRPIPDNCARHLGQP